MFIKVLQHVRLYNCFLFQNVKPSLRPTTSLSEVELVKVILKECVFDGFEDDPDVLCVRGTGVVGVKVRVAPAVLLLVHLQDELFRRFSIAPRPCGGESGQCERESVYFEEVKF